MMDPFICIDVETTGLHGKPRGWVPRVIEIGAVVVTGYGEIRNPINTLVLQDREHLEDPGAAFALNLTGITIDEIQERGIPQGDAVERLTKWLQACNDRGVCTARAYNQRFDFGGFLQRPPWSIFRCSRCTTGECIMLAATAFMDGFDALPRWDSGEPKWAKAEEAIEFFKGRGHAFGWEAPTDPAWGFHRATYDAYLEAQIAVAIAAERGELKR